MSKALIVREQEPLNLEMPFSTLDGFITPNESFYVRCHFPMPEIAGADWRLKIEGEVDAPFELSYEELLAMEKQAIAYQPGTIARSGKPCAADNFSPFIS